MAANTNPIFPLTPQVWAAPISAANTARDGSGTIVDVATGGTNGSRISRIVIQATVTTTAGMVRLFIKDNAGTPNIRLWREVPISALTPSATVQAARVELELFGERGLVLPPSYKLCAATHNAEAFNVFAEGGDY